VYGSPPYDEPVAGWERVIHSKAAFNLLLDGTYDEDIDVAMRELDPDKRARLTHDLGQKSRRDAGHEVDHVGGEPEGRRLDDPRLRPGGDQLRIRDAESVTPAG